MNPLRWLQARVAFSQAKYPSLSGRVDIARRIAHLLPRLSYNEDQFFCVDGAPDEIIHRRRVAFFQLSQTLQARAPNTLSSGAQLRVGLSDHQFPSAYRVPFPFGPLVQTHLDIGVLFGSSDGPLVTDLDGNAAYDLSGSCGVNLFGHEFYKRTIEKGFARVKDLGPLLGAYHPLVIDNVERLRSISKLDQVSFHMSGTEAVAQAIRLARYHTQRPYLVRFAGAEHGRWDDAHPFHLNPTKLRNTLTMSEMNEATLRALSLRDDIACVLVNPLQALAPNQDPFADSMLIDSSRNAGFDREAYTEWLTKLRKLCSLKGIVFILNDIFLGFRIALGGTQSFFNIKADLVIYGKTLGGGLPVGALCGRAGLMKRVSDDRLPTPCLATGTFNHHPYVMGSMNAFLIALETPEVQELYKQLDKQWDQRAQAFNTQFESNDIPLRVAHLSTVWTFLFPIPSRYNWMLQFYLHSEGIHLSWAGSGRLVFSLDYDDRHFTEVTERVVRAAQKMKADGWWWTNGRQSNFSIKRSILSELIHERLAKRKTTHLLDRKI